MVHVPVEAGGDCLGPLPAVPVATGVGKREAVARRCGPVISDLGSGPLRKLLLLDRSAPDLPCGPKLTDDIISRLAHLLFLGSYLSQQIPGRRTALLTSRLTLSAPGTVGIGWYALGAPAGTGPFPCLLPLFHSLSNGRFAPEIQIPVESTS